MQCRVGNRRVTIISNSTFAFACRSITTPQPPKNCPCWFPSKRMGVERLYARTNAGFDLKVQASLVAVIFTNAD
ncbi:MAG: hypothetical protein WCS37_17315 [Chloroflexota bacterium]